MKCLIVHLNGKTEGVIHKLTVPKKPEQNGVAERLNRTLVEMIRSMLINSKLLGLKHYPQLLI